MRDRPRRFRAAARSGDQSRAHCENRGESDIVRIAGIRHPRESRLRGMGMRVREDYRSISGLEKAAILLMSLGEEQAAKLFGQMDDEEIKEISQVMASLGTVSSNIVERLFVEFADPVASTGCLFGSPTGRTTFVEE